VFHKLRIAFNNSVVPRVNVYSMPNWDNAIPFKDRIIFLHFEAEPLV